MAGGLFQKPVIGQPARRAAMQQSLLFGRQCAEALAQHIPCNLVHAQPLAVFVGGEDGCVVAQAGQAISRVVLAEDRAA